MNHPARFDFPARRWVFSRTCFVAAVAAILLQFAAPGSVRAAAPSPIAGRYRLSASGQAPGGGVVDIDPRRVSYTVNWRMDFGKPLRGLGLADGNDLLGVSLYTGGIAHGLAIYRRDASGKVWRGRWITSIDSASIVGSMDFDTDPKQTSIAGRHHFSGQRVSTGQFDGTVTITPQGSDYTLAFTTAGGTTLYRGVGILRGERLVVAWSFGSSPSLAVFEAAGRGELSSRRVTLRSRGALDPVNERMFPADSTLLATSAGVTIKEPRAKASSTDAGGLSAAEPAAPAVKTMFYGDLMARYGASDWAERWLSIQLTSDEQRLLRLAVTRRGASDPAAQNVGARTVSQLIDEQRGLQGK